MIQGRIVVDWQRCKGCGLCGQACPQDVLHLSESLNSRGYHPAMLVETEGRHCTGCAICALVCPEAGIVVYRQARSRPAPALAGAA